MVVPAIDLLHESALLLGAVCFSLGILVFSRGISNKLHLSYGVLSFMVSLWALSFFLAEVVGLRFFESVHIIATLFLGPVSLLFLHFLLRPEGNFFWWLTRVSIVLSGLLIPMAILGLDRYYFIRDVSYYSPALIVCALTYLFVSEVFGGVAPRGIKTYPFSGKNILLTLKRRNVGLYLGGVLVTLICVMDRVPWLGRTVPALGNFLLGFYIYCLMDVVLQTEYVSFRRLLGKLGINFVSALIIGATFVLVTVWVTDNPLLFGVNVFLASYLAIVSMGPISSVLGTLYQKTFFKEASRIEDLTVSSGKELVEAFSAELISDVLGNFIKKTISGEMTCFYALDDEGKKFEKVFDITDGDSLPPNLSISYPLVKHWQQVRQWKPILISELEAHSDRSTLLKDTVVIHLTIESLQKLAGNLALPMIYEEMVLGFVIVKADAPPSAWGSSWGILPLLETLFRQGGKAMHDLDVYSRLKERDRLAILGEMSAGLAHEIRNPLGAIKGAAQVLELKSRDQRQPFVDIIVEEVNRLNGVVTQFLDYAKPFKEQRSQVDLAQLARVAVQRFERLARSEGCALQVELKVERDLPLAFCQPDLVSQVISNLLDNALDALIVKHQRFSDARLSLNVEYMQGEGNNQFLISVIDNGRGIEKELMEKVFIPFYTFSRNGTGLGLPICQRVAEAHDGRLELFSDLGMGTKAVLRFPAKEAGLGAE